MVIGIEADEVAKTTPTMKTSNVDEPREQPKAIMKNLESHLVTKQPITPVKAARRAQSTRRPDPMLLIVAAGSIYLTLPVMIA